MTHWKRSKEYCLWYTTAPRGEELFSLISFETTVHSFQGIKFVIGYSTQNSETSQEIISKTDQQRSAYLALSQLFPQSASTTKKTKTSSFICRSQNQRCSLIPGHSLSSSLVLIFNNLSSQNSKLIANNSYHIKLLLWNVLRWLLWQLKIDKALVKVLATKLLLANMSYQLNADFF